MSVSRPRPVADRVASGAVTWFAAGLFFIVATPFEAEQSGFVYLTKGAALAGLLGYAILVRGARPGLLSPLPALVIAVILVLNTLVEWSDRAILAVGLMALGTLLGQARSASWNREFRQIVQIFLLVHAAGFLVTFLVYYLTSNVLDLHGLIFPVESRAESLGLFARLSGFHTEPGTYAQWMLMSLFLFALISGQLISRTGMLILATSILTVSLWAVLGVTVFLLAYVVEALLTRDLSRKAKITAAVFGIILAFAAAIQLFSTASVLAALDFLQLKGSMITDSGLDKLRATRFFFDEFWNTFIFGRPMDPGFCPYCLAPQDAGVGMNGVYYFGFLLFFSLFSALALVLVRRWTIAFVLPLGLALLWKAHFYDPLLWIIVGYILHAAAKKWGHRRHGRSMQTP